jgi:ABC-type sulfate transport system permease component
VELCEAKRHPGVRADVRLYHPLSQPDRADPDRRPVLKAATTPIEQIIRIATSPRTLKALEVSFGTSLIAALVNVVFGTHRRLGAGALSLSRPPLLDAIVDLPFALPTAVAGIALSTLYAPKGCHRRAVRAAWLGIKVAYTPSASSSR